MIKKINFAKFILLSSSLLLSACDHHGGGNSNNKYPTPDDDTEVQQEKAFISGTRLMPINPDSEAEYRVILIQQ